MFIAGCVRCLADISQESKVLLKLLIGITGFTVCVILFISYYILEWQVWLNLAKLKIQPGAFLVFPRNKVNVLHNTKFINYIDVKSVFICQKKTILI